jgi:LuxR family transcriptional regulator, maltose regulon positive regulatory protein
MVPRPRLNKLLTRAMQKRVTLVSAGPGSGKTVGVASWVAAGHAPAPVAWLHLDEETTRHTVARADAVRSLDQPVGAAIPQLRILPVTRSVPSLHLHRMRIADELSDIHNDDLAFDTDEADRLINNEGLVLRAVPAPLLFGLYPVIGYG